MKSPRKKGEMSHFYYFWAKHGNV